MKRDAKKLPLSTVLPLLPHCTQSALGATVVLKKREAEADPQFLYPGAGPVVHHPVTQVVKAACQEVTTEHCVDVPIAVEKATPVETCHVVTKVDCAPQIHQIPKTVCEPAAIETVEVPAPAPAIAYAFPGAVAPHVVAAPLAPAAVAAEPAAVAEA